MTPTQRAFLAAFATSANVSAAATAAGIDRCSHYRWLRDDSQYAEAFKQATEEAAGVLEDLAVQRATDGIDEPVLYKGELIYEREPGTDLLRLDEEGRPKPLTIRRRSDALLTTLLKAWMPVKFRDNHHIDADVSHRGLSSLTDAELERIALKNSDPGGSGGGAAAAAEGEKQDPDLVP